MSPGPSTGFGVEVLSRGCGHSPVPVPHPLPSMSGRRETIWCSRGNRSLCLWTNKSMDPSLFSFVIPSSPSVSPSGSWSPWCLSYPYRGLSGGEGWGTRGPPPTDSDSFPPLNGLECVTHSPCRSDPGPETEGRRCVSSLSSRPPGLLVFLRTCTPTLLRSILPGGTPECSTSSVSGVRPRSTTRTPVPTTAS